jgi:hypothetical protein
MKRSIVRAAILISGAAILGAMAPSGSAQAPAPAKPTGAAAAAPAKGPDKVVLVYRAKKDLVARYKNTSSHEADVQGRKLSITSTSTEKVTVSAVAANGNITFDQQSESIERTFNGQHGPPEDLSKAKSTFTIAPDGKLISMQEGDAAESKSAAREFVAQSLVYPAVAVGVGDKWSRDFTNDDTLGRRDAHADFEVLASEMKGAVDTFKVKMEYREKTGSHPIHTVGTFVVEKSSGDALVSDVDMENEPGPDENTVLTGKLHSERVSGSPFDAAASAASKPETKTIDDVVKGYDKLPGYFTIYRKKENGRDTIYAEIKEDQLGKLMLLQTTAATGNASGIVAGDPIDDLLFKLDRHEETLQLVTPNINFRADDKSPISRAVRRSFADGILESFRIEAKQPDRKSLLINLSEFFRSDIAQIGKALSGGGGPLASLLGGGGGGYGLDREKTYVASVKNFPENLCVETQYHFIGGGRNGAEPGQADPRSLPLRISYAMFPLLDHGFKPRPFDPRVGYFETEFQSFDDDSKDDPNVRYIYRWNLEKADPSAKMSPPKKPIVFWLDNAIPTEYRDAVREGLLAWNAAFEKIGIKDAIVVKQQPDNADWDHADMRYNTIRWVASPSNAYAVAQARVNPMTGEILNADITVDANFTRSIKSERRHLVNPASYFDLPDPVQAAAERIDPHKCEMAQGMVEQAWFGSLALNILDPENKIDEKAYLHSYLRHVVTHEMGHIMGLRHNFIASTCLDAKDLTQEQMIGKMGVAASVMDYTPFNVFALKHKGVDFYQAGIGPYDYWAIEYGYASLNGSTPAGDVAALEHIATRCNDPGLAYQSDEDADAFDPNVVRFDLAKNPLDYYQKMLSVSRSLLLHLGERVPKNGESYYKFTQDFQGLLGTYTRSASLAARYVGGLHLNRNFKGDPHEKPTLAPIDAQDQKRALQLITTYVLSADAFTFPRSYYTKLTSDPNGPLDIIALITGNGTGDFPIRDQFASIQRSALNRLFNPTVLKRIVNNEFKVGDESRALTLPYLFHSVGGTVWSELDAHKNIGTLHRQLQRSYVDTMAAMILNTSNPAPDDAKLLAWGELKRLKGRIASAQRTEHGVDEYTKIHLAESLMRIDRALDARATVGGSTASAVSPLQALLGGASQK